MSLAEEGRAVLYSEEALRDVLQALGLLIFGCPPIE
jgi:hypothetical protein